MIFRHLPGALGTREIPVRAWEELSRMVAPRLLGQEKACASNDSIISLLFKCGAESKGGGREDGKGEERKGKRTGKAWEVASAWLQRCAQPIRDLSPFFLCNKQSLPGDDFAADATADIMATLNICKGCLPAQWRKA